MKEIMRIITGDSGESIALSGGDDTTDKCTGTAAGNFGDYLSNL